MHAFRSVLLFAALVSTTQTAAAQPLPSAVDIIAKHVQAIGGKEAIIKISSYKQVGTMEFPGMGLSGEMENYSAAPNMASTRMNIPALGEIITGTNGLVAWYADPMQGPRVLEDKELAETKASADFYGNLLFPADRYTTMENVGVVDFNGEKTYKIKLVRKDTGRESTQYFSVGSGLNLGSEAVQSSPQGDTPTVSVFGEYKEFGGVKLPMRTEVTAGTIKFIFKVSNTTINGAPVAIFDVPEAIKPLIKK